LMKIYLQKLNLLLLALWLSPALLLAQTSPTPTPSATPPTSNADLTPITGLPGDPQPNLSTLAVPNRPLPGAERIGVDQMNQKTLTLDEAITLALQNNNDVDNSRIGVKIAEFNLRATLGVYDPNIVSESFYQRATTPTASTIGGAGSSGSVTQTSAVGNIGATGFSPRYGGSYQANFTTSRTTTNNQNATLNPQFPSNFTLTYTQPLWRGRKIDNNRRNIEIAKKNLSLTDAQFRQKVIDIVTQVEQGYWDLVFALRNLQVQNDAVKQAQIQLESNKRLVKQGVLAPIEIVAATAQITTFEQNVFTAQDTVTRAENTLKTLISKERTADIWSRPLTPVTPPELDVPKIPLENAVSDALKNRPELFQLQKTAEINEINTRYLKDQLKPQINFVGTYTSNGLAGTANPVTRTSTSVVIY
jgi:outer membrane protein